LIVVYGYALLDGLFTSQGLEMMRHFHHQGDWQSMLSLLRQLPWLKSLAAASLQWGFLLGILLLATWARSPLERMAEWLVSFPRPYFLLTLVILAFTASLAVFYFNYQFFPRSGDAHALLFQARVLAKGALSVPSHAAREFFNSDYIINNGRMYAEYPLGTSFMLMWGVFLGIPWLINPLLAALALVFVYYTANELYGELIARYGVLILLASPLYFSLPPSYLSHAPQLFFLSVFIYFFLKTINVGADLRVCPNSGGQRRPPLQGFRPGDRSKHQNWHPLVAGVALGMALNTRPMTALTFSLPLLAWASYLLLKDWQAFYRKALIFLLGLLPFLLGLFLINQLQNGHPLVFGHQVYNGPRPTFGFNLPGYNFRQAVNTYLFRLGLLLKSLIYPPLSAGGLLVLIALSFMNFKKRNYLLWGFFALTSLGYLPVLSAVWHVRYYYTASLYLLLLLPLGISNLGQWLKENFQLAGASSLLSAFLLISLLSSLAAAYRSGLSPNVWTQALRRPYDIVAQAKLNDALVFVRNTEHFYPEWYTRNSPELNDPVLWVRDLGKRNQELMVFYPERKAYLYDKGKLTPLPAASE